MLHTGVSPTYQRVDKNILCNSYWKPSYLALIDTSRVILTILFPAMIRKCEHLCYTVARNNDQNSEEENAGTIKHVSLVVYTIHTVNTIQRETIYSILKV